MSSSRILVALFLLTLGCGTTEQAQTGAPALSAADDGPPATKVVVLKLQVGADGAVQKIKVVRGVDPQTDATAVKHAWEMRFQPARRQGDGQAVESTIEWKYRFETASAPTE